MEVHTLDMVAGTCLIDVQDGPHKQQKHILHTILCTNTSFFFSKSMHMTFIFKKCVHVHTRGHVQQLSKNLTIKLQIAREDREFKITYHTTYIITERG